ncbi:30S ribosomal protein S5 [Candidatus Sneabacter namystus]|uniref:Small ribosomal subunit protein uS5 n=1 Tax=Candidatus Sneabacter namystus TaxID=2601646 RepID=A0A5C0UJS8_9RICK|nr:30S ribosomal protein S5 [Candidatus Sneabacter namystus]QEK39783.1 30S ribosomal protein S5 [Candidatus Sneabacter namystus]
MQKDFRNKKIHQTEEESQISESVLSVRRVTKVVEMGRTFSFSTCVAVGDKAGRIGFASGHASEALSSKAKAVNKAKRRMMSFPLYQKRTIHHDVQGRSGATKILLRRASAGTGIIAGVVARAILENLGIKDIVAKSHGSSNPYTVARAILNALGNLCSPGSIAKRRDKSIHDISINAHKEKMVLRTVVAKEDKNAQNEDSVVDTAVQ